MSATAHSDFFGLDLDPSNNLSPYTVSPEAWAQAQENLSRWIDLEPVSASNFPELSSPDSLTNRTKNDQLCSNPCDLNKSPSLHSNYSILNDDSKENHNALSTVSSPPKPLDKLTDPASSKITKAKQFHFVANSDKKTAVRLRNTMTSRNLRQSKVSRIAQLEKELEEQLRETKKWKARAVDLGWKGEDED